MLAMNQHQVDTWEECKTRIPPTYQNSLRGLPVSVPAIKLLIFVVKLNHVSVMSVNLLNWHTLTMMVTSDIIKQKTNETCLKTIHLQHVSNSCNSCLLRCRLRIAGFVKHACVNFVFKKKKNVHCVYVSNCFIVHNIATKLQNSAYCTGISFLHKQSAVLQRPSTIGFMYTEWNYL